MTLYRKYRPQTFTQIIGQPQVTEGLAKSLAANQPAHAYLFAGSRGTGKTSVARIVAKSLNCLNRASNSADPCGQCQNCLDIDKGAYLDVVEIDAASHNGVEHIRDLIEQVQTAPIGNYKVYILDEVHMLSTAAFNALLKTLEEPPRQVVFILCTTESHKVPVTIASRCQRYVFSQATIPQLVEQLHSIAKSEKIAIDQSALELIAELADGGYRDAEMLLEQVAQVGGTLTREVLQQKLGLASHQTVQQLIMAYAQGQVESLLQLVEQFVIRGGHIRQLTDSLLDQTRQLLLFQADPGYSKELGAETKAGLEQIVPLVSQTQLLQLARALLEARQKLGSLQGAHQSLALETALLGALQGPKNISESPNATTTTPTSVPAPKGKPQAVTTVDPSVDNKPQPVQPPQPVKESVSAGQSEKAGESTAPSEGVLEFWPKVLDSVRTQSRSVEALLRDCVPLSFDGTILVLQFWYAFHKTKLEADPNRTLVEQAASRIAGHPVTLKCELGDKTSRPKRRPMAEEDLHNVSAVQEENLVDAAVDIFGGEIVN